MPATMKPNALRIDARDNVVTVLTDLQPGELAVFATDATTVQSIAVIDRIPYGHKVALSRIGPGETVVKYGAPIGQATAVVPAGAHVHQHNVTSRRMGSHA